MEGPHEAPFPFGETEAQVLLLTQKGGPGPGGVTEAGMEGVVGLWDADRTSSLRETGWQDDQLVFHKLCKPLGL